MSEFDHLNLNGRLLRLFLATIEEGSVTRAAARLGLTQSAASHGLDRLEAIVGTALFVKSGRNIAATPRALALVEPARGLLADLRRFTQGPAFEPQGAEITLTVAANDLQADLLLPDLRRRAAAAGATLTLRVIASGAPNADLLRSGRCDLAITPRPPDGADILRRRLLDDAYVCFYDQRVRAAPADLDDYLAADHVTVVYDNDRALAFDQTLLDAGIRRRLAVSVPGFSSIPPFLRGSAMLASLPSLLRREALRDFATATLPFGPHPLVMFLAWHVRHQADPTHRWLRGQIRQVAATRRVS